jgi:cyclopropane-fatty-acyl-phospholipid synthase
MGVGEAYMDGRLTIENDDLRGFMELAVRNVASQGEPWFRKPLAALRHALRWVDQFNPMHRAQANVAHHYDLSGELYDLFLDEDRQYSCAYFRDPDMTLEEAQAAKKAHIAGKLMIEPGMRVLDIGCGWGGMGLTLARDYGARGAGRHAVQGTARGGLRRARRPGWRPVPVRADGLPQGRRQFDRIVSVGMFEHVGVPHYREYFTHVHKLPEGRWRRADPHHRAVGPARRDQPVDHQIHLSRRLLPVFVRSDAPDRGTAPLCHRYRGVAAALRRDAAALV